MSQFLAQSDPASGQPIGVSASPVHSLHARVRSILRARLGQPHADLFAMPVAGADGRISWSTELSGPVVRESSLPPDERQRLQQRRDRLVGDIQALAQTMAAEGPSSLLVSQILQHSVRTPPGDWLFSVGGRPVLTLWGHAAPGEVVPDWAAPAPILAAASAASPEPARLAASAPDEGGRGINAWWLLPVLAALLVIGLALLLRGWEGGTAIPAALQAQLDTARQTNIELTRLLEEKKQPSLQCTPDPVPKDPPPAEPVAESPARPPARTPKPDPDRVVSNRTQGRRATDPLKIPPGALEKGDFSFLNGLWQLDDDRVSLYRVGDPSRTVTGSNRVVLEFDASGSGSYHRVEGMRHGPGESRGAPLPDVSSPLRVQTDGKTLTILVEQSKGRTQRLQCEPQSSGQAQCTVVNPDGHRWEAPLRRIR
jgi:hypothetical protein